MAEPARRVPLSPRGRVDPHLLQLDCARRPRRCLRLEEDRPLLFPEPGPPLVDLRGSSPANPSGSRLSASTPSSSKCVAAQAGTSSGRSSTVAARRPVSLTRRRLLDHIHRLSGSVLPRPRHGEGVSTVQSWVTASSFPMIMRVPRAAVSSAKASQPRPDGTTLAPK